MKLHDTYEGKEVTVSAGVIGESSTIQRDLETFHYETLDDLLQDDSYKQGKGNGERVYLGALHENSANYFKHYGFTGGPAEVLAKVESGWIEGADKALQFLAGVQLPQVKNVRRRRTRAAFGDSLDIHRVLAGDLDKAWDTTVRVRSSDTGMNNVTVLLESGTPWYITSEQAFWRGATAVALSDMLSSSGRSVELLLCKSAYDFFELDSSRLVCASIQIKDFESPLDLGKVAITTSIGFHRTLVYKALSCAAGDRRISASYGGSISATPKVIPPRLVGNRDKVLYIPYYIFSKEKALSYLDSASQLFL